MLKNQGAIWIWMLKEIDKSKIYFKYFHNIIFSLFWFEMILQFEKLVLCHSELNFLVTQLFLISTLSTVFQDFLN